MQWNEANYSRLDRIQWNRFKFKHVYRHDCWFKCSRIESQRSVWFEPNRIEATWNAFIRNNRSKEVWFDLNRIGLIWMEWIEQSNRIGGNRVVKHESIQNGFGWTETIGVCKLEHSEFGGTNRLDSKNWNQSIR